MLDKEEEKDKRRFEISEIGTSLKKNAPITLKLLAVSAATIVALLSFNQLFSADTTYTNMSTVDIKSTANLTTIVYEQVKIMRQLQDDVHELYSLIQTTEIPEESIVFKQLQGVSSQLINIEDRLSVIENTVLDTPEKALENTLLSRDLQDIRTDMIDLRSELARNFEMNRWLVGIMATLAVGL